MKEVIYKKTGKHYILLYTGKLKRPDNGEWVVCAIYMSTDDAAVYSKEITDFEENFEVCNNSTATTDVMKFQGITIDMIDTFIKKNHDYGNSFEQSLDEEGLAASRIRMGDKWNRYKALSRDNIAQVKDESIQDTLLDMANYAIMTVMWLNKKQK